VTLSNAQHAPETILINADGSQYRHILYLTNPAALEHDCPQSYQSTIDNPSVHLI
jgi:hypothetical protein